MSPDEARRILGISESATQDEITLAGRRHAAHNHPDKVPGREDEFRKGVRALRVLRRHLTTGCPLCEGSGTIKKYRSAAIVDEELCPKCWGHNRSQE